MTEQQKHDPFDMSRFRQDICPAPTRSEPGGMKPPKDKEKGAHPNLSSRCLSGDDEIWGDERARNSVFYMA